MGLLKGGCGRLIEVAALIEVTITACVWAKIRDFENWPLNKGWPLSTGPLYTGSTVYIFIGVLALIILEGADTICPNRSARNFRKNLRIRITYCTRYIYGNLNVC